MSYAPHLLMASLLLALAWQQALGQTFHYSRGWTNGKRSEQASPMAGALNLPPPQAAAAAAAAAVDKLFGNPCDLERFRNWLNSNNMRNGPCDFLYDEGRYKRDTA